MTTIAEDIVPAGYPGRYEDPYEPRPRYEPSPEELWQQDSGWTLFTPEIPESEPAAPYQVGALMQAECPQWPQWRYLQFPDGDAPPRWEFPGSVWLDDMDAEWAAAFRALPSREAHELQVDAWAAEVSACTCQVAVTGAITEWDPDCTVHAEQPAAPAVIPVPDTGSVAAGAQHDTRQTGEQLTAPGDLAQVRDGEPSQDTAAEDAG